MKWQCAPCRAPVWVQQNRAQQTSSGKSVEGWLRTAAAAADPFPARPLLSWQNCCWSCCLRPVVAGCCRPSLHVSVRQALPDLSRAGGLPAPRRGPPLHHIPSNYWHPAAFEHTGIIVKNSRGQTADGEGWKRQNVSKRERKRRVGGGGGVKSYLCHWCLHSPCTNPPSFWRFPTEP